MKKTIVLLLASVLFSVNAFAAAATVTKTSWGYSITGGTSATLIPQDTWATSTAYVPGQKVSQTGHVYKCLVAHTSGTFATDLTALKWVKIAESTIWLLNAIMDPAASTDKASFTALSDNGGSDTACFTLKGTDPQISFSHPSFYAFPFMDLKITLTSASDIVNLYVFSDNFTQN